MAQTNGSSQATECNNMQNRMPNDDQCFLLYWIMGTYFGPDIKGEKPQKSILQRIAEGLPPYTSDQLAGSYMKTMEIEHVYYYVLRKADESLTVKLPLLHQFFQGNISLQGQDKAFNYPQFPDLFPSQLHPQSQYKNRYYIIENIVFINKPEIVYINPEDIERFKKLTRLEDFFLDRDTARLYTPLDGSARDNVDLEEAKPNGNLPPLQSFSGSKKTRYLDELYELKDPLQCIHVMAPVSSSPDNMAPSPPEGNSTSVEGVGPAMMYLPSHPTKDEWSNIVAATKSGFALTGSAAMGQVGPIMGLIDIGECEDSYLFRISLPGVKRDESEFSCEVDTDGKVLIRGVTTTGEKTVCRYSEVFEMQTQNLPPPGNFSISFQLPGPVDPQQFSGNFGADGILEGIVMKGRETN
ncbi:Alpha-crystallin domain-containing protein 22.3 [Quillaja saponaria]|uniref:Alpha-crystallin domain-containing protein 22.3 n=1 Tax=Quillaja saponaria TaxID=32244 RepID=A0AAD7KWV7_QUISA|nr:Alpha-crystallin domain-containing protein 22.3 [Quillaja saponaria]KAJ7947284.1 Alpha-crystallin domain-containing protein 22.3 [Quillaja saponaria]